ncbi:MAG: LamG-like jellyroll fold domain-containing protein [Myxococcota bacterium]
MRALILVVFAVVLSGCGRLVEPVLIAAGADGGSPVPAQDSGVERIDLDVGLNARIRFDEGEGNVARAESDRNFIDGLLPENAVWVDGRMGGAVELFGQPIRLGNTDRYFDAGTSFSASIWMSPSASSTTSATFIRFETGLLSARWADDRLTVRTSNQIIVELDAPWLDDEWHLLALVYDRPSARFGVFIDGRPYFQDTFQIGDPTPGNARIGEFYYGRVDDFRIYARALSAAEVAALWRLFD